MKRDMDLIREILLKVEEAPAHESLVKFQIENCEEAKVSEHVYLLGQSEYLEIEHLSTLDRGDYYMPKRLIWKGYELLADIKNETRWKIVKENIAKIGGASLPIWQQIAAQVGAELITGAIK